MDIKRDIQRSLRANRKKNVIYLNNPKSGCSTIKATLWKALSPETYDNNTYVHDVNTSPFVNRIRNSEWVVNSKIFTFVRNPYSRVVSAYLEKIANVQSGNRTWFGNKYKIPDTHTITFAEFIEIIESDDSSELDPHWRPQYLNITYPLIKPNFIGNVEDMQGDLHRMVNELLGLPNFQPELRMGNKTDAGERVMEFLKEKNICQKVVDLYERDFEYFGYSCDVSNVSQPGLNKGDQEQSHKGLADLLTLLHD